MTNYINTKIDGNQPPIDGLNVKELAAKFTLDVVSNCIFAIDSKTFTDENSIVGKMGKQMTTATTSMTIYLALISMFPSITKIYKKPFVAKNVEEFFVQIMKDALKYRDDNKIERSDILDHLRTLKARKNLSELETAAHSVTFFFDGFETSSIVIAHVLYELARNTDVQQKLRDEILEKIEESGDDNEELTFEAIQELKYIDLVFSEALRLHSPAMLLTKKCTIPIELDGAKDHKVKIDKGTVMLLPVYSIHRNPENYQEPDKFMPERFDPDNGGVSVKTCEDQGIYLPFGNGPRKCLGQRFARTQSKACIIEIIKNFQLSINKKTQEPLVLDPKEFLCYPKGGLWVDFKKL